MNSRGRTIKETAQQATLSPTFRAVDDPSARGLRTFEQVTPIRYTHRPSDEITKVINAVRPLVWQTVSSGRPYRRYYLYLSPAGETRLTQLVGSYALLFWLGSLTRYQPLELLALLDGSHGPFLREFLATQPSQMVYSFASEFARQDVARAAVV